METHPASLNEFRALLLEERLEPSLQGASARVIVSIAFFALAEGFAAWSWNRGFVALYPISWFISGTAVTSLFVLGHDCAHFSFLKSRRAMTVLGHFFFLPSLYPFHAWRHSHNAHHAHTNSLEPGQGIYFDNAWSPITLTQVRELEREGRWVLLQVLKATRAFPPFGSFLHLFGYHYRLSMFKESHRSEVVRSILFIAACLAAVVPWILWRSGAFGVFHFILLPAAFFHFWMSAYTFAHHTHEDIPCFSKEEWTPFKGQVLATANRTMPAWLSYLHHHIDVHLPHHVSTSVPCYRLREAQRALERSPYRSLYRSSPYRWQVIARQVLRCQVWDEQRGRYLSMRQAGVHWTLWPKPRAPFTGT